MVEAVLPIKLSTPKFFIISVASAIDAFPEIGRNSAKGIISFGKFNKFNIGDKKLTKKSIIPEFFNKLIETNKPTKVGNIFNVTRQCISEIEINAFQKIRKSEIFNAYLNEEEIKERYYSITKYFDVDLDYIKLCLKYVSKEVQRNVYDTWGPDLQRRIKYSKFIPGISTFINCLNTYKNLYNETKSLIAVENAIKNPDLFHLYEIGALENIYTLYSQYSKKDIYECIKSTPELIIYLKINPDKKLDIKAIFESDNFWQNYLEVEELLANNHKLVLK